MSVSNDFRHAFKNPPRQLSPGFGISLIFYIAVRHFARSNVNRIFAILRTRGSDWRLIRAGKLDFTFRYFTPCWQRQGEREGGTYVNSPDDRHWYRIISSLKTARRSDNTRRKWHPDASLHWFLTLSFRPVPSFFSFFYCKLLYGIDTGRYSLFAFLLEWSSSIFCLLQKVSLRVFFGKFITKLLNYVF